MTTLGILGGMGPYASITFYRHMIELSGIRYGAVRNDEYPHLLVSNLPVPDLILSQDSEEITVSMVEEEIRRLEKAGADFLVLACNTMHLYIDRFRSASSVPFLSMTDAVVQAVLRDGRTSVGILGSSTSIRTGLYTRPLEAVSVRCLNPSAKEQELISMLIANNIGGNVVRSEERAVYGVIDRLRAQGAQAIILGCTELPLVLERQNCSLPVYDSLRLLAEEACRTLYEVDLSHQDSI